MARSGSRGAASRIITPGALRRGSPVQFFKDTISELRKSVWPTREETVRLTYIVILITAAAAILLAGLDFILGQTFGEYIIR